MPAIVTVVHVFYCLCVRASIFHDAVRVPSDTHTHTHTRLKYNLLITRHMFTFILEKTEEVMFLFCRCLLFAVAAEIVNYVVRTVYAPCVLAQLLVWYRRTVSWDIVVRCGMVGMW